MLQAKAYTTRVGAGPYPTEVFGNLAEDLRRIGVEYGTTTGRPRRVGWLDIPALRYATRCFFRVHRGLQTSQLPIMKADLCQMSGNTLAALMSPSRPSAADGTQ